MNLLNNIVGLFVGSSSKKRQMAVLLGLAVIAANWLGYIDAELTKQLLALVGVAFGYAVSARLTKLHKEVKK